MAPPSFSDIGKASKDLLSKDYPVGSTKFEFSTTTPSCLKITTTGEKDNKTGSVLADLKLKFSDKPHGLTVTQTVKTSGVLSSQLELANAIGDGTKFDIEGTVSESGKNAVKVGAEYKLDQLYLKSGVDLYDGPTITGDITASVSKKCGWLIGTELAYDVGQAKFKKVNYATGYIGDGYIVAYKALNRCTAWEASYYRQINTETEVTTKASGSAKSLSDIVIEIGAKYNLGSDAFIKVKTDNLGRLGLGYTQSLREGIKLSLGGLFDTTRLHENVHKIGLSLSFEA